MLWPMTSQPSQPPAALGVHTAAGDVHVHPASPDPADRTFAQLLEEELRAGLGRPPSPSGFEGIRPPVSQPSNATLRLRAEAALAQARDAAVVAAVAQEAAVMRAAARRDRLELVAMAGAVAAGAVAGVGLLVAAVRSAARR